MSSSSTASILRAVEPKIEESEGTPDLMARAEDVRWQHQDQRNTAFETRLQALEKTVTELRIRMARAAGFAAAVGALAGSLLERFI